MARYIDCMENTRCTRCFNGKYQERPLKPLYIKLDEYYVYCSKCGHKIDKYQPVKDKQR